MPLDLGTPQQLDAAKQIRQDLLNQQLLQTMGTDAALGLGLGASAVGVTKLVQLLADSLRKKPDPVQVPTIRVEDHRGLPKQAGISDTIGDIFSGGSARDVNELPYGLSARALALLLGAGGGAMMAGKLTTDARNSSIDQELEQARAEFEAALSDSKANATTQPKLAAAFDRIEKAAADLNDPVLSKLDKRAGEGLNAGLSQLLGVYALMAMLGGGTAAYYGYKGGLKNQKARKYELAHAAKQQRDKQQDPYRPVAVLESQAIPAM